MIENCLRRWVRKLSGPLLASGLAACGSVEEGGVRGGGEGPDGGEEGGDGSTPNPDGGPDAGGDADTDGGAPGPKCDEVDCHALATCDDSSGTALCTCIDGYGGDGIATCEDVDECASGTDTCDANAMCSNTEGSYTCVCNTGYTGDGMACADADECADGTHACHTNADCTNVAGGHSCACKAGFTGDGAACADIDECAAAPSPCPSGTTCRNTSGAYECDCAAGFELYMGTCTDKCVVAKADGTCDAIASCSIVGNDTECSCPPTHFDQNGNGSLCVMNADCATECTAAHAICVVDSPTVVHCECATGYDDVNGDGSQCPDINECSTNTDMCHAQATCANTQGGYTCQCGTGFTGNGFSCTNVNECTTGTDTCDPNATCTDTSPGFTCACNAFYQGNGFSCTDINECMTNADDCHANANCTNQSPGWSCACKAGYTGNGTTTCTDVNECMMGTDNCHTNATCTNTGGSYACACNAGYVGNGTTVCNDLDECATGADNCDPNATCTNLPPPARFSCACNYGYTGSGTSCTLQFCDLAGTWALEAKITTTWQDLQANIFPYPVILEGDTFTATVWEKRTLTYNGTTLGTAIQLCGSTFPDAHNPALNETYGAYIPFTLWDTLGSQAPFTSSLPNLGPADPFTIASRGYLYGARLAAANGTGAWPAAGGITEDCATPGHGYPCWSNDDMDAYPASTQWSRPPNQTSTIYSQAYDYPPSAPQVIITRRVACSHIASRSVYSMAGTVNTCSRITGNMTVTALNQRLHSCRRSVNSNNEVNCDTNTDIVNGQMLPVCSASDATGLDQTIEDVVKTIDAATFKMVKIAAGSDCGDVRSTAF